MNINSIDTLTCRQLDAIIATKVMKQDITIALGGNELEPVLKGTGDPVPFYSMSQNAAWQVIKFLVKNKHSIAIDYLVSEEKWRCIILDENSMPHTAIDAIFEFAICRAALMQAGILEEKDENRN